MLLELTCGIVLGGAYVLMGTSVKRLFARVLPELPAACGVFLWPILLLIYWALPKEKEE